MSEAGGDMRDWTEGEAAILYQRCGRCRHVWYFHREFCPRCGDKGPERLRASGRGTVAAVSLVARAPSAELRQYAPYCIVLVDAEEGFRMMAQGDKSLALGDRVVASFVPFAGRTVPYFQGRTA
jgi:uncharacterized OB-fold protein